MAVDALSGDAVLRSSRGKLILALLCGVALLDFIDGSIMNVALPSIRRDLHFSVQNLQWVLSAYLVTYGGFLLLGGRVADLVGRRRVLVAGTWVFALCSLTGGFAPNAGVLVGARLVQGVGAAAMMPAALSILTTTFTDARDRAKALGAWGGMAGLGSAAGVFLGGLLSESLGWRWVLFVNVPVCAAVLLGSTRLIPADRPAARASGFDLRGAVLVTAGTLLLVFTLVRAPGAGWGSTATVAGLFGALVLLSAFVVSERRIRNPLAPLSIFRIKGLAAADATQLIAIAGFYSTFFFITLYMQNVLGYSQLRAGSAYLPVTLGVGIAAALCTQLFARMGTRPVIIAGSLVAAAGVFYLSRIPLHGAYLTDLLPGLLVMAIGLGAVFVGVTTAANAGVPTDQAGLAAALLNTSQQLGAALGLAVLSAIATSRTSHLLAAHTATAPALTAGFQRALQVCAILLVVAAVIAGRAPSTRGGPSQPPLETDERKLVPVADPERA